MRFPQGWELVLVLAVVVLLFGTKKLPDAARGLGRSLRIFKSEVKSMQDDEAAATTTATATPATPTPLPSTTTNDQAAATGEELRPETPPRVEG